LQKQDKQYFETIINNQNEILQILKRKEEKWKKNFQKNY
jgi:hypothetical protein